MRMPWSDKTGFAKVVAILATILMVSSVTCGINFVLSISSLDSTWVGSIIGVTSILELVAMAGSLAGLLVVLVIWIVRKVQRGRGGGDND